MQKRSWLVLLGTMTAIFFGVLASSASAGRLSLSNQQFRVIYRSFELVASSTVRCEITFEGSYHARTIAKVLGSLIGYITRVAIRHPCVGGEIFAFNGVERLGATTLVNSLPWHLRYEGFGGTLPNITSDISSLSGARFAIRDPFFGILCIVTTGAARGLLFGTTTRNTTTGVVDALRPSGTIRFDAESSGLCGTEASFTAPAGDGVITLLGTTTKITLTLI